jgi:hypothetical protein
MAYFVNHGTETPAGRSLVTVMKSIVQATKHDFDLALIIQLGSLTSLNPGSNLL